MSTTFADYQAQLSAGFARLANDLKGAGGDITRHAWADIADTYQDILTGHASTTAPDGLTGTFETVTTPQVEGPMGDKELAELIAAQPEQQPAAVDITDPAPDAGDPDMG